MGALPRVRKPKASELVLLQACQEGDADAVSASLAIGVNPDFFAEDGNSPLLMAASAGYLEVLDLLLCGGADPDIPSLTGNTPLRAAVLLGDGDCILCLLSHGASVDIETSRGTALIAASTQDDVDTLSLLLQHGARIDQETKSGSTALLAAVREGHTAAVKLLLDKGADPMLVNIDGKSPVTTAEDLALPEILSLLLQKHIQTSTETALVDSVKRQAEAEQSSEAGYQASLQAVAGKMAVMKKESEMKTESLRAQTEEIRRKYSLADSWRQQIRQSSNAGAKSN